MVSISSSCKTHLTIICLKVLRRSAMMSPADCRFADFEGERGAGMSLLFGVSARKSQSPNVAFPWLLTVLIRYRILADLSSQTFVEQLMGRGGFEQADEGFHDKLPASWAELFGVAFQQLLEA